MKKIPRLIAGFIAMCALSLTAAAQCPYATESCECATVTMPPDQILCSGDTYYHDFTPDITVPSDLTIGYWYWTPGTVVPPSGVYPTLPGPTTFTPLSSTTYSLTLIGYGPNMINNGDFSAGTACFNTAYTYYTGTNLHGAPANYVVGLNPSTYSPSFGSFADHSSTMTGTPTPYNMLIAEGKNGPLLWEETDIPVCPDQDYMFSFWLANAITCGAFYDAMIRVEIDGVTYGPFSATGLGIWQLQSVPFHSSSLGGTITIRLYDDQPLVKCNGFAIDDISLNRVCKTVGSFNIIVKEITGPTTVCVGNMITLSSYLSGGTWSCTGGATIDAFGHLTGVTPGPVTVTYIDPAGCEMTYTVTVIANPVTLTGPASICEYDTEILTWAPPGLVWSASGYIYPTSEGHYYTYYYGTATVTYTDPSSTCYATHTFTVNQTPDYIPTHYLCIGDVITLSTMPTGGTWVSSVPGVASIGYTTGILTALMPGYTTITYTTAAGCVTTTGVYVYDCSSGVIIGGGNLCEGYSSSLIGLPGGGTWTSSDPSLATIDPVTGVIYAVPGGGGGPVTFTYVSGGITTTITLIVKTPETACVTQSGGDFTFTTSCASTATVYYRIYSCTGAVLGYPWGYSLSVSGGTGTLSYAALLALPYGTYTPITGAFQVCVYRVDCEGCSWPANCCATINCGFKPEIGGSTHPEDIARSLTVVPNPNTGAFNVLASFDQESAETTATVEITDMMGKVVYSEAVPIDHGAVSKSVSLNRELANGIYIIRVHNTSSSQVTRFVLDR